MTTTSRLPIFLAGVLGGLTVLLLGAVLIATDVIDTGDSTREVVREPAPLTRPAATSSGEGRTVADIVREEGRGVVYVQAEGAGGDSLFGGEGTATGSGFVIDEDGTILTNAHVVEGSDEVSVSFEEDGSDLVDAEVLGRDADNDIAVLKIDPDDVEDLTVVPLGDSSQAVVGDPVVAIGNPFGRIRTVTTGIVSATERRIDAPNGFSTGNVIQTDAAINPGNSGGPLLDSQGRAIGINAQIATGGSGGSVGIGFAIPINTAKELLPRLKRGEEIKRAFLGVSTVTVGTAIAEELELPVEEGALVVRVSDGSPADEADLESAEEASGGLGGTPEGGDVIVAVDGEKITTSDELVIAVEGRRPGEEVELELYRGDDKRTVTVELAERPDEVQTQDPLAP